MGGAVQRHHNASLSDAPCCSPNTMTASITASPQGHSTPHQRDRAPPAGGKTARTRKKSSILIVSTPAVVDHRGSAVCSSSGPTLLPLTCWIQIFCCVVVPLLSQGLWVMSIFPEGVSVFRPSVPELSSVCGRLWRNLPKNTEMSLLSPERSDVPRGRSNVKISRCDDTSATSRRYDFTTLLKKKCKKGFQITALIKQ